MGLTLSHVRVRQNNGLINDWIYKSPIGGLTKVPQGQEYFIKTYTTIIEIRYQTWWIIWNPGKWVFFKYIKKIDQGHNNKMCQRLHGLALFTHAFHAYVYFLVKMSMYTIKRIGTSLYSWSMRATMWSYAGLYLNSSMLC